MTIVSRTQDRPRIMMTNLRGQCQICILFVRVICSPEQDEEKERYIESVP